MLNVKTSQGFFAKWHDLVNTGINKELLDYLIVEGLLCTNRLALCYTNQVFDLDNTSTNRVELAHSSLKTWLHTSLKKLNGIFLTYHRVIGVQVLELKKLLEEF